jgi:NTE family protein
VVFREGKVIDAVKSSMRVPNLFSPFKDTERHLIDGSVIYPTPVFPLHKMGANITIAVAVMPSPDESHEYFRRQIKGRATQEQRVAKQNYALVAATFDSLMERLLDVPDSPDVVERVAPDLFILPDITGITWRDFHRVNELIELGASAAKKIISKIEELKWREND